MDASPGETGLGLRATEGKIPVTIQVYGAGLRSSLSSVMGLKGGEVRTGNVQLKWEDDEDLKVDNSEG